MCAVIIPAAGVGKRMQANRPKQYLTIEDKTLLEHTVLRLLSHSQIALAIVAISPDDEYFAKTSLANHPNVRVVAGGKERADSVLSGLNSLDRDAYPWVLVHDAARPCVSLTDVSSLIETCLSKGVGGILASPVRDTMKRTNQDNLVTETVERELLWHALTPQMYPSQQLCDCLTRALTDGVTVTDESSTIERAGLNSLIVKGSSDNIKVTQPEDLALAEFILTKQKLSGE
ncbi:2-C-methyl-D-erythritol 4-phosphate cytidylyltransferase [Thalassotalea ganghwensis]